MSNITVICDIPYEDGTTPRERNNAMPYSIPLGSKVSYLDIVDDEKVTITGYVLSYLRDCDGTPLYMIGESIDLITKYKEANEKYLNFVQQIPSNSLSKTNELMDLCDKQSLLMLQLFTKFNNRLSARSLTILDNSDEDRLQACQNVEILWGPEMYKRLYNKYLFSYGLSGY